MSVDEKLKVNEERKAERYEAVKDKLQAEVDAEIAREAEKKRTADEAPAAVARHLKEQATREIVQTESELKRAHVVARISQVVDYVFYLIYGIVGLLIVLELFGARESAGFKQLMDALAEPLVSPFRNLMWDPSVGPFQLMLSYIVALIVYMLLHMAINGLLRILAHKKTLI